VAAFHVSLELTGKLECPRGLLGLGTAPQQSLVMFAILIIVLAVAVIQGRRRDEASGLACAVGLVLGALFAVGSILSAPPLPPAPDKAYSEPLTICRPPFRTP
jgi:hypothetical protein